MEKKQEKKLSKAYLDKLKIELDSWFGVLETTEDDRNIKLAIKNIKRIKEILKRYE